MTGRVNLGQNYDRISIVFIQCAVTNEFIKMEI